jgi:hypothetical protein
VLEYGGGGGMQPTSARRRAHIGVNALWPRRHREEAYLHHDHGISTVHAFTDSARHPPGHQQWGPTVRITISQFNDCPTARF